MLSNREIIQTSGLVICQLAVTQNKFINFIFISYLCDSNHHLFIFFWIPPPHTLVVDVFNIIYFQSSGPNFNRPFPNDKWIIFFIYFRLLMFPESYHFHRCMITDLIWFYLSLFKVFTVVEIDPWLLNQIIIFNSNTKPIKTKYSPTRVYLRAPLKQRPPGMKASVLLVQMTLLNNPLLLKTNIPYGCLWYRFDNICTIYKSFWGLASHLI